MKAHARSVKMFKQRAAALFAAGLKPRMIFASPPGDSPGVSDAGSLHHGDFFPAGGPPTPIGLAPCAYSHDEQPAPFLTDAKPGLRVRWPIKGNDKS